MAHSSPGLKAQGFSEQDYKIKEKVSVSQTTLSNPPARPEGFRRNRLEGFERTAGNLSEFKKLDPVLQKRLIPLWLTSQQVTFSPSNAHIEEIIRFLDSPRGGTHHIHTTWCINKKQGFFYIIRPNPRSS